MLFCFVFSLARSVPPTAAPPVVGLDAAEVIDLVGGEDVVNVIVTGNDPFAQICDVCAVGFEFEEA